MERTEGVGVVRRAKTATRNETLAASRTSSVRNGISTACPSGVLPAGVGAGVMVLDRRTAQAHAIFEAVCRQDVVAREPVVAVHAARLANADLRPEGGEGLLVTRNPFSREADILERLAPPGDLTRGQKSGSVALTTRSPSRRNDSRRVMIVAVMPSTGVMWSLPSRRGMS